VCARAPFLVGTKKKAQKKTIKFFSNFTFV